MVLETGSACVSGIRVFKHQFVAFLRFFFPNFQGCDLLLVG